MSIFRVLGNPPFCGSRICVGGWGKVGIRAYRACFVQRDTPPVEDDGPVDSKLLRIAKELEEKYVSWRLASELEGRVGAVYMTWTVHARACAFCSVCSPQGSAVKKRRIVHDAVSEEALSKTP